MNHLERETAWRVIDSDMALDETHTRVRRDRVEMHPGSRAVDYYVWEGRDIATVVPQTPAGDFILCRQYRHALRTSLLQFPAGQVDAGESPAAAAERELLEETGYTFESLMPLATVAAYPTKFTGRHHLFLALNVRQHAPPQLDSAEEIAIEKLSRDELAQILGTPDFIVADSVAAAFLALRATAGVTPAT